MMTKKEKITPVEVQNTYKIRFKLPNGKIVKRKYRKGDIIWTEK